MASHIEQANPEGEVPNALRSWVMVGLTFVFVIFYAAALLGWLKPLADEKMVARIEPIIFVIVGYYFGRLPAQQNESTLKGEINRQTKKADAAQHAKEQAQQTREGLEEKMKNIGAALASVVPGVEVKSLAQNLNRPDRKIAEEHLRHSVTAAVNILNS
jgi:hypothetical protein